MDVTPTMPTITRPSGLLVPTSSAAPAPSGLIVPGGQAAAGTTRPSGLFVPSHALEVPKSQLLVVHGTTNDAIPGIAQQEHAALTSKYGRGAADAMMGTNLAVARTAHADIVHDRIIAALRAGDVAGALASLQRR